MIDVVVFSVNTTEIYQHLQQNTMVLMEGRVREERREDKRAMVLDLNRMYPMSFADKLLADSSKKVANCDSSRKHTQKYTRKSNNRDQI